MNRLRSLLESSFRAKVLVPVIVVMVFLLAITASAGLFRAGRCTWAARAIWLRG